MTKKDYVRKGDFLTLLIEDELFKDKEEFIVDECITFLLAGTQTTTLLVTNALYNLAKWDAPRDKLREEMLRHTNKGKMGELGNLTNDEWRDILLEKQLIFDCNYIAYVVAETLRMDTSVPLSSRLMVTEDVRLECGYTLKKWHSFQINMHYLHHNPS